MVFSLDPHFRGSSPHTRGAPQAGTSLRIVVTDHPRIRGEHSIECRCSLRVAGSSPHTRGAPLSWISRSRLGGIIPAYAGSTATSRAPAIRHPDHPRIRGEHPRQRSLHHQPVGSSPHTRGALETLGLTEDVVRIIPAYAGSTDVICMGWSTGPDHPRIRGEHPTIGTAKSSPSGSSPHTRGALALFACAYDRNGIIPAYAGSTTSAPRCARPRADHPRIRGEHATRTHQARRPRRIIPAYAGSTGEQYIVVSVTRDHPRIRGEHESQVYPVGVNVGSSPHTRGAPHERRGEEF